MLLWETMASAVRRAHERETILGSTATRTDHKEQNRLYLVGLFDGDIDEVQRVHTNLDDGDKQKDK